MAGHWAEVNLKRAVEEKVLNGFDDGNLHPDDSITMAQALKIICCILKSTEAVEYSKLGVTGDEWYAPYAAQAAYMGIDFSLDGINSKPLTRSEAFTVLADAFRLTENAPDLTALEGYMDVSKIPEKAMGAMTALVKGGYVEGFAGYLNADAVVSRAEFISVLYRMVNTVYESGVFPTTEGNLLISAAGYIPRRTYTKPVWIGCSSGNITLNNVKAETVIYLGQNGSLTIGSGSSIKKLVISGADSDVTVYGKVDRLEVEGKNNTVNVRSAIPALAVEGNENNVNVNSLCKSVYLAGTNCTLAGYGRAERLMINTRTGKYNLQANEVIDLTDYGLQNTKIALTVPDILPAGEVLVLKASVENPETKRCIASWKIDGVEKKREVVTIGENTELTYSHSYTYTEDMALESDVELMLYYLSAAGEEFTVTDSKNIKLENYGPDHYRTSPEEALKMVTCEYAGDYTLEWALANDYTDEVKEVWINAKGYSSKTEYLCWINLTYQRVNIFKGEQGNWELIRTCLGASGAGRNATPVGVYTVFNRSARGWKTSSYWCKPVVNFYVGTGYAFHSRLYHPTKGYLTEPDIGYPVSHGCIRMYDEDIQWIFDNIPNETTVVVH